MHAAIDRFFQFKLILNFSLAVRIIGNCSCIVYLMNTVIYKKGTHYSLLERERQDNNQLSAQ